MSFFWCKFGFRKCFGAFSQSNRWAGDCRLLSESHLASHNLTKKWFLVVPFCGTEERHFKTTTFLICGQLTRHPLFHLSNLLQMPNDHRMVDIEFFGNFSYNYRGSASMMLSIGHFQLLMAGHYTHPQGSCLLCKTS